MADSEIIHVAYADDHVAVRRGIISFIEGLGGVKVTTQAANGKDLIAQLEEAGALPDVVMLDINMPEMDGFETMTVLRQQWPEIKALVLTTYNEEYYIIEMINRGANGYLLKSCHPEEIKTALTAIKQNGYYYSETATVQFFNKVRNGMAKLPHFTDNEIEFMKYCPSRLSYEEIAAKMNTTYKSVLGYRDRLYEKLDINNRVSLAMFAIQMGFAQVEMKLQPDSIFLSGKK